MKNTVFPHKFLRPFLDCMPQLFFRPQYVWFPVHLKGHLIPLCYETLVVNWQNWLFTLFHQSRSVLSPNPIVNSLLCNYIGNVADHHWEKIAINNAIAFHCVTAVIDFPIADITQTIFNHYANGQIYPKMPIVALCWDISRHSDGAQWCIWAP